MSQLEDRWQKYGYWLGALPESPENTPTSVCLLSARDGAPIPGKGVAGLEEMYLYWWQYAPVFVEGKDYLHLPHEDLPKQYSGSNYELWRGIKGRFAVKEYPGSTNRPREVKQGEKWGKVETYYKRKGVFLRVQAEENPVVSALILQVYSVEHREKLGLIWWEFPYSHQMSLSDRLLEAGVKRTTSTCTLVFDGKVKITAREIAEVPIEVEGNQYCYVHDDASIENIIPVTESARGCTIFYGRTNSQ